MNGLTPSGGIDSSDPSGSRWSSFTPTAYDNAAVAFVTIAAFCLYLASAFVLQSRAATELFGSDTGLYDWLAYGNDADRVTRFHPLSTALIKAWMYASAPLNDWMTVELRLKVLFASVGALGVWAAMSACTSLVQRQYALWFGVIYATSLGCWYFSSIAESKIISATLATLYIATYIKLRANWTHACAVCLSMLFLLACLNEIVAGFLVVVPVVDALFQRGIDLRSDGWIVPHALIAPGALAFLDFVVNGRIAGTSADPEQASHVSMLLFYLADNDLDWSTTTTFLSNWLLFNFAAPSKLATHAFPQWPYYHGFFAPGLGSYLASPWGWGLALILGIMVVTVLVTLRSNESAHMAKSLLLGLLAYTVVRGGFFYLFDPNECLLFSASATLAHMVLIGMPFAASALPCKSAILALGAIMLFVNNAIFIFGL